MFKLDKKKRYIIKSKVIIYLSMIFLISGVILKYVSLMNNQMNYKFDILNINIKDISIVSAYKKSDTVNIIDSITTDVNALENSFSEVSMMMVPYSRGVLSNRKVWYLPVEIGTVTTNPNYSHIALDITSPRGMNEAIYPVANGEVSGIYTDAAGARIITVKHLVDGVYYSSQYVHLSRYGSNLYIGKQVTINDILGYMGQTGIATGTHLHIALIDCNMFSSDDSNCRDLNSFFRYSRLRYNQGFRGLQSMMEVPTNWTNR